MRAELPEAPIVIAVDGPAASGKGTLARRLAEHFGYAHLDTGLLYRAVGMLSAPNKDQEIDPDSAIAAAKNLTPEALKDPALRGEVAAMLASKVAVIPAVRTALVNFQRRFAEKPPDGKKGAILDGRDIGTVICPDANRKIFIIASPEARAERRVKELRERDVAVIYARVLQDMKERDARDRSRRVAPLVPADDAFLLDTTSLDADASFVAALEFITSRDKSDE